MNLEPMPDGVAAELRGEAGEVGALSGVIATFACKANITCALTATGLVYAYDNRSSIYRYIGSSPLEPQSTPCAYVNGRYVYC